MKTSQKVTANGNRPWFYEFLYLALPMLALTPNFFQIPDLNLPYLVTQQIVFCLALLGIITLGLWQYWRQPITSLTITRTEMMMAGSLLLFLLWQTISLSWSADRGEGIRFICCWFGFLIFLVGALRGLHREIVTLLMGVLVVFVVLLVWSLFYEYRVYGGQDMLGIFFNHGITAELLGILLPFFICIFLFEKDHTPTILVAALLSAVMGAALLLTVRRGPILGVIVAAVLTGAAIVTKQIKIAGRIRALLVVGMIFFVILPVSIYQRDSIISRVRGAFELKEAATGRSIELGLTGRATMWLTAWEMGKRNWLKGVGIGAYAANYGTHRRFFIDNPAYQPVVTKAETEDYDEIRSPLAHSEYLQIFAELGILGITFFSLFWLQVAWQLWQKRKEHNGHLAIGALASLLAFAVSSVMSAFSFHITAGVMIISSILAIGLSPKAQVTTDEKDSPSSSGLLQFPKPFALIVLACALALSSYFFMRSYNVYASQQMQSGLDFKFALNNAAENEALARRYQKVIEQDPHNDGAHLGYATLLFQMKRLPESLENAEFAFRRSYNRPYTFLLMAFAHEQLGQLDRATELMKQCVEAYPKSIISRVSYAELLFRNGQIDEGNQQRAQAETLDKRLAQSWSLAMRMKVDEAVRVAKERNLISPDDLRPNLVKTLVLARAYHYLR